MNQQYIAGPGGRLTGRLRVPGDKSISHRSIMLGALAQGTTRVDGFLEGADALATRNIFAAMGVTIRGPQGDGRLEIDGVGLEGLKAPAAALDCGNSGTSMRLLSGLLSGCQVPCTIVGDESLSRRPMRRVIDPLAQMGARIDSQGGLPPLTLVPGARLKAIDYAMPVASAQVKSAVLLAGLGASGSTRVTEPAPTRDHTERMLTAFGVKVERDGATATLEGGQVLKATAIDVPADLSSAAFFLVAASIAEGSDLTLEHVGVNPTRTGVLDILKAMGADITLQNARVVGGEPVADIRVRSARLRGIDVLPEWVPLAIDEFPVLFVAAACAEGVTRVTGAEELRVKESDRIQVMADGLVSLGANARPTADGMVIEGRGGEAACLSGGRIDSRGDHRIAMSFAVASLRAACPIEIDDVANVNTSFPGFARLASGVGLSVRDPS